MACLVRNANNAPNVEEKGCANHVHTGVQLHASIELLPSSDKRWEATSKLDIEPVKSMPTLDSSLTVHGSCPSQLDHTYQKNHRGENKQMLLCMWHVAVPLTKTAITTEALVRCYGAGSGQPFEPKPPRLHIWNKILSHVLKPTSFKFIYMMRKEPTHAYK